MTDTDFCSCKRPTGDPGESCIVCGFMIPKPGEVLPADLRVPPEEMQVEKTRKTIELYVCPTPGCSSATIAKPGEKLEEQWTGVKSENRQAKAAATGSEWSHNRAECPDCRQRGAPVQRIRLAVPIDVPNVGPPTPPLPPSSGKLHAAPVRQPEG